MNTIPAQSGYVPPQGEIWLYTGVPLNPNHTDVVLIDSPEGFKSTLDAFYTPISYSAQSYSRITTGKIRIQGSATILMSCNYMAWHNYMANIGNWFFAFITGVEYINVNVTEITYVIDNYATWFPYLELGHCFVEREIPKNDELYGNLVPENLELGEFTEIFEHNSIFDLGKTHLLLIASTKKDGTRPETTPSDPLPPTEAYMNGVLSSLFYEATPCDDPIRTAVFYDDVNEYISNGYGENIIAIWLVPHFVLQNVQTTTWASERYAIDHWQVTIPTYLAGGYQPKNKKLFTAPYRKVLITNHSGQTAEYHYEDFKNKEFLPFTVTGCAYGLPSVMVEPYGYKNSENQNPDYGILLTNFPQAPTLNDTYKAYLAQNKASIATSILSSITSIGLGIGVVAGSAGVGAIAGAGMIASGASGVASTIAKVTDAKASPTTVSGLIQSDGLNMVREIMNFEAKHLSIKYEMAEVIDNYFSAFGYACHKVKIPDIKARSTWSYVQTKGCILTGSAPYQAKQEIIQNFDAGIRVWKNITDIGHLEYDNL